MRMASPTIPKIWRGELTDNTSRQGDHATSAVRVPGQDPICIADTGINLGRRRGVPQPRPVTPSPQHLAWAEQIPLLRGLSLADHEAVLAEAHERSFPGGHAIFREGDAVRMVVVLVSGQVKMTQQSPSGEEIILSVKGGGKVVGTLGFPAGNKHFLTARTLDPCVVLAWDVRIFEKLEEQFAGLRRNAMYILAEGLKTIEERFLELATEQVGLRLARMLTRLLEQNDLAGRGTLDLSREELAQMLGTTLFTVGRLLSEWEKRGLVQTQRKAVLVKNPRALIALAESGSESD
jgi:CRP/FNR family transcriptional regulator, nitrogen oxide reductase regulator